jgi:hypothetical protein
MERIWLQHRYMHAFNSTQKWTAQLKWLTRLKIATEWADKEKSAIFIFIVQEFAVIYE